MSETIVGPKPYELEHVAFDRIAQRLDVVADTLGFEESAAAAQAKQDLIGLVDDGHFDSENSEHRALLGAYQIAAEEGVKGEDPGAGYQLALAGLWFRLDDPGRFYERIDGATEILFHSHLDAALVEVYAIVDDLESLNQR